MKIGVIGAGTMGQGIAKAFAQVEGNTVALCDIKQEWAENGLAKIKKACRGSAPHGPALQAHWMPHRRQCAIGISAGGERSTRAHTDSYVKKQMNVRTS